VLPLDERAGKPLKDAGQGERVSSLISASENPSIVDQEAEIRYIAPSRCGAATTTVCFPGRIELIGSTTRLDEPCAGEIAACEKNDRVDPSVYWLPGGIIGRMGGTRNGVA